jgi:hypothetical protein
MRTFSVPSWLGRCSHLAFDGQRLILAGASQVLALDSKGRELWRTSPPIFRDGAKVFITDQGRTLSLFDYRKTLYRYRLPQQ